MSWDRKRGTANRYYYRNVRRDGRPIKQYVGSGEDARRAAEADAAARRERAEARQAWLQQWAWVEAARQPLDEFCEMLALLTKGLLVASGWHQHGGVWRRRMMTWTTQRNCGNPLRLT